VSGRAALLAVAAALGLGGTPAAAQAGAPAAVHVAPVSVVDDAGHTVTLARPAQRIVAVAPHITELLFAAGAGGQLVGVDAWSNHPAAATALPRVGDLYALDLERIVALKPDLIVVWRNGNSQRQLDVLRALGLPIYEDGPTRLDDIARSIGRLGRLAGHATTADAAAAEMRRELAGLRQRFAAQAPVTVFYQVWNEPLLTVNDGTLIGDVIALCGGRNVFGHLPMQAPRVNVEAVLEADPQLIVAAGLGPAASAGPAADVAAPAADDPAFAPWRRWPRLRAVREHGLVSLPDDLISRHTPRVLQGAGRLCAAIQAARTRR
jgi:iron complex transport system substrate-binding protein